MWRLYHLSTLNTLTLGFFYAKNGLCNVFLYLLVLIGGYLKLLNPEVLHRLKQFRLGEVLSPLTDALLDSGDVIAMNLLGNSA
jgi:hypothetical protein